MIDIIITSYKEPKATLKAVKTILKNQSKDIKVTVVDPFPETEEFLKKHIKDKRFEFYPDPGEGKAYALNMLIQERPGNKDDIFVFTDGDVYVSENAINEIKKTFSNKKVGCVTCKPVSLDSRKTKYGYWSNLLFSGIDKARKKLSKENKFIECSGYLFAIRKGVITDFPMETSEDSIIPYLFWRKGYNIKYLQKAEVYIKNPSNWNDWENQKIRNIKAHENLNKIAPNMPRTKSFFNEIKHGWYFLFIFPKNLKEVIWTFELFIARFYIYLKAFKELRRKKIYKDGWRETEINSTKPLD